MSRFRNKHDRSRVRARCKKIFGVDSRHSLPRDLRLVVTETHVLLGNAVLPRSSSYVSSTFPPTLLEPTEHLMKCIEMDWPVLLVGPSGCGKSTTVSHLAKICGRELHIMSMSSGVDASELLGCYEQMELGRHLREMCFRVVRHLDKVCISMLTAGQDLVEGTDIVVMVANIMSSRNRIRRHVAGVSRSEIESESVQIMQDLESVLDQCPETTKHSLDELRDSFKRLYHKISNSPRGRFEWIDGTLIKAVQHGGWVLLDNVNLCSPSVLDRLNSLLEPGGSLLLTECGPDPETGKLRRIKRHADFRLICT